MSAAEIATMFPTIPAERFLVHDFRRDLAPLGEVPASFVREVSGGRLDMPIRSEVDARLVGGHYDRIFSIGQLVPHEVAGIAGQSKNIFIGLGGKATIDATHFLGAVSGMEAIMGRAVNPVRDVLSYMAAELANPMAKVTHLLTVRARDRAGTMTTRGLFAGDDDGCYFAGAPLARDCNVEIVERPLTKVVVFLDPSEFRSTWLGNKAVYRTRMALDDGGELVVLAPGVERFGEDGDIDRLIRQYGYRGTERTLAAVAADPELRASLSAAAHLIHGSSEGRFRIRYATSKLDREAIEAVGYEHIPLARALDRYDPACLTDGVNVLPDGEEIFFVSNPAVGLWSVAEKMRG
jgi:nickel-dependent lactate racemase